MGQAIDLRHNVATNTEFDTAAWVLYPSREYLPLKGRVFVDYLKESFAKGAPAERTTRSIPRRRS